MFWLRAFSLLFCLPLISAYAEFSAPFEVVRARLEPHLRAAARGAPPPCPNDIQSASEIVFAFDGAGGHCPLHALNDLPSVDFGGLAPVAALYEALDFARWRIASNSLKEPSGKDRELLGSFEKSFGNLISNSEWKSQEKRNCALLRAITQNLPTRGYVSVSNLRVAEGETQTSPRENMVPDTRGKRVLYYGWDHLGSAQACAKKLVEMGTRQAKTIKVSIIGYSLGGSAAKVFYETLPRSGVRVDRVVTLDAVPRYGKVIGSLIQRPFALDVDSYLPFSNWKNIFQRFDQGSLNGISIQGVRMNGRTRKIENTSLTKDDLLVANDWARADQSEASPRSYLLDYAHVSLLHSDKSHDAIRAVFN